jgi:hypothetical protein
MSAVPLKCLDAALLYAQLYGWTSFPVPPGTKKSHTCAERSKSGRRWGAERDPKIVERYFRRWFNANIGLPCGPENGFFVIDADTPEGHEVDGVANFAALVHHHKPLPDTLRAISPTGSRHFYFKYPSGKVISNSEGKNSRGIAPGVDVRGEGGMVLAPPSRKGPRDQRRYRWENWGKPIAEAPSWLLKLVCRKPRKKCKVAAVLSPHAQLELIEAALDVITRNCLRTGDWPHDLWFEVGAALHNVLGGDGLSLFDNWSSHAPTYDEGDVVKMWDHCSQDKYGSYSVATIYHYANAADPHWRDNYNVEAARKLAAAFSFRRERRA